MLFTLLIGAVQMGPELQAKMAQVGDDAVLHVYTVMAKQPDHRFARGLSSIKARAQYYRSVAAEARRLLVQDIESGKIKVEKYYASWTNNSVELWIKKSEIKKLLDRNDIVMVELVPEIKLHRPRVSADATDPGLNLSLWNIHKIQVDTVWVRFGLDGSGILLATMDTGIDTTHPALQGKVIKMKDFTPDNNPANDGVGHGTHTAGTVLGGNGYSDNNIYINDIGVAPGAQLVHAKIFDHNGTPYNISAAFDWIAALKADSGYDIRAVGNSWGSSNSTSTYYWNSVMTWRNLGILPVFSIGNDGPSAGSAGTPGNYPTVIGVGATNSSDLIADFSSRGPAPNQSPWNNSSYWFIPDWNLIKPDIAAPGVSVRSSIPGGGYTNWDGTSMASPHVTGATAILLQANPSLTPEQLYRIFINTAYQRTDVTYPNNDYGWGRLDVLEAVLSLQAPVLEKGNVNSNYGSTWDPGETMTFDVQLINVGSQDALNVQGSISTTSSDVTISDADATWPDIPAGDSAYSNDGGFTVQASASAADGTNVSFQLVVNYQDASSNTYSDTFYVSFVIGQPSYLVYDVDAGNLIVTISNNGAFPSSSEQGSAPDMGSGFVFGGGDQLYYGGFALGKALNDVSDMWYGPSTGNIDSDFSNVSGIYIVGAPPYATFKATAEFQDAANVKVIQDALTFDNLDNAVVIRYWITNAGGSSLSNLYAGLFMDFDIGGGSGYNQNTGDVDASRNLVYLTYNGIYTGVVYVGSNNGTSLANLTHLHNPTYVYNGTPDSTKYKFLSGALTGSATSADDYTAVVSAGPFDLSASASDTVVLTFGLIGATSLSQLQETADSLIGNIPVSSNEKPINSAFYLAPRYHNGSISILLNVPSDGNVNLSLFDISGRKVATLHRGFMKKGSYTIDVTGRLNRGVYILKADTDFGSIKKPVVVY